MSEKADRGIGVTCLKHKCLAQAMVLQFFWWKGRITVRGVSGSLIGTHPQSCWSLCAENIPQKPKEFWDALGEKQDGKRGKTTYTFNAGDIVPLVCVYP